jgi:hypothetical protein
MMIITKLRTRDIVRVFVLWVPRLCFTRFMWCIDKVTIHLFHTKMDCLYYYSFQINCFFQGGKKITCDTRFFHVDREICLKPPYLLIPMRFVPEASEGNVVDQSAPHVSVCLLSCSNHTVLSSILSRLTLSAYHHVLWMPHIHRKETRLWRNQTCRWWMGFSS